MSSVGSKDARRCLAAVLYSYSDTSYYRANCPTEEAGRIELALAIARDWGKSP